MTTNSISIQGGSDATPFASGFEFTIDEPVDTKDESFNVINPEQFSSLRSIQQLNLRSNNDHKNIGLAFARGFSLKEYLSNKGISEALFDPIEIEYDNLKRQSKSRKCNIDISFRLK